MSARESRACTWRCGRPVTEWSNAFLAPPPDHAIELLTAAGRDPRVADAFVEGFNDPQWMWRILGAPDQTAAWLAGFDRATTPTR